MWIVKIGGSLADSKALKGWLDVLACYGGGNAVIVPGGGPFADHVRLAQARWNFREEVAHRMALLAMEQYGIMLAGLRPDLHLAADENELRRVLEAAGVPIWLPSSMALQASSLTPSWDVTSDSLAAWLAATLGADGLLLVKYPSIHAGTIPIDTLQQDGMVDPAFREMITAAGFSTWIFGQHDYDDFRQTLYSGVVAGTLVVCDPLAQRPSPG